MVRRIVPQIPDRPKLSIDQKRRAIARLQKRIGELEAFDPQAIQKRFSSPEVTALETAIDETLSAIFGHGTIEYRRYSHATPLDTGPVVARSSWIEVRGGYHDRDDLSDARRYTDEGREKAIALLKQAVKGLEEEIAENEYVVDQRSLQSAESICDKSFCCSWARCRSARIIGKISGKIGTRSHYFA